MAIQLLALLPKVGVAVKALKGTKVATAVAKKGVFSKVGSFFGNLFNKAKSNTDSFGNPFGKFGQAVGQLFKKDSNVNQQTTYQSNQLTQYIPIGIVGFIIYQIFKK